MLCFVNFCCQHTLRTERKEKGYSPFKVGKDWYLALYDNEQEATDEEFEQFNKMNVEKGLEFLKEIYPDLQQKVVDILKEKCENDYKNLIRIDDVKKEFIVLELLEGKNKNDLLKRILESDIDIERFGVYEPTLNDIFVSKAGDK